MWENIARYGGVALLLVGAALPGIFFARRAGRQHPLPPSARPETPVGNLHRGGWAPTPLPEWVDWDAVGGAPTVSERQDAAHDGTRSGEDQLDQ